MRGRPNKPEYGFAIFAINGEQQGNKQPYYESEFWRTPLNPETKTGGEMYELQYIHFKEFTCFFWVLIDSYSSFNELKGLFLEWLLELPENDDKRTYDERAVEGGF